jgi:hypothetical protein
VDLGVEGLRSRRHHNNRGDRQIRTGKTAQQLAAMCRRLKLPFRAGAPSVESPDAALPGPQKKG